MTVQHVEHELDASETAAWSAFVTAWWTQFHDEEVSAEDLFPVALAVLELGLGKQRKRSQRSFFEQALGEHSGSTFAGYRMTPNRTVRGVQMWRLLSVTSDDAPFEPSAEWQIVPEGFPCPPGGEFNMNLQTGVTLGRWPALLKGAC